MSKQKNDRFNKFIKFVKPLPLDIVNWYSPTDLLKWYFKKEKVIYIEYDSTAKIFKVEGLEQMSFVWNNGFFGKGILSRSEPTWHERTLRRLALSAQDKKFLSNEEVVKLRRLEREDYKSRRKELDLLEIKYKSENSLDKLQDIEKMKLVLNKSRGGKNNNPQSQPKVQLYDGNIRDEDYKILIDGGASLVQLEYLELMTHEVLFLKILSSNSFQVRDKLNKNERFDLLTLFINFMNEFELQPGNKFLIEFFVYYYFKSLNWCVKSGLKFSSDFIIYERGPVFHHAEFSLLIKPVTNLNQQINWVDLGSVNRVLSTVKKSLVLVYVQIPSTSDFNAKVANLMNYHSNMSNSVDCDKSIELIMDLLKLYDLNETIVNRWSPSRTRE